MTTAETLASYEAQRAAAVARLARAREQREIDGIWQTIAWLDAQIRRVVLTPASAARMETP